MGRLRVLFADSQIGRLTTMSPSGAVRWFRVLYIVLALCLPPSSVVGAEDDDITYQTLVQRVKGGDSTVDFRALRLACMKSSQCEPRGSKSDLAAMLTDDVPTVVTVAERLIDKGFVNVEAHATAAGAYAKLNKRREADTHFAITLALMRSIMATRDGKTKESAYEVICDREEYSVLNALGLPFFAPAASMAPVKDGPHSYERWEVQSPKTGQTVVVFFNIDAFSPNKSRARDK